jgi:hypothetical protein
VIHEIRVYEAADGKAEVMKARFKNEVIKRFPNHGIELLGVSEEPSDAARLTYLTRFKSEVDHSKAWAAFGADREMARGQGGDRGRRAASQAAGRRGAVACACRSVA